MEKRRDYLHSAGLRKEGLQVVFSGAVGQVTNEQFTGEIFVVGSDGGFVVSGHLETC